MSSALYDTSMEISPTEPLNLLPQPIDEVTFDHLPNDDILFQYQTKPTIINTTYNNQLSESTQKQEIHEIPGQRDGDERVIYAEPPVIPSTGYVITAPSHDGLQVAEMEHCLLLPDYPVSHKFGYGYCIDVRRSGVTPTKDSMQYGSKQQNSARPTIIDFFGGIPGTRQKFQCTGVRMCSKIDPYLRNISYYKLTEEIWKDIRKRRGLLEWDTTEIPKKRATEIFFATHRIFSGLKACGSLQNVACRPVLRWPTNSLGYPQLRIECIAFTPQLKNNLEHYSKNFPTVTSSRIDLGYLEELFNSESISEVIPHQYCGKYYRNLSKMTECGAIHYDGQGHVESPCSCKVEFNIIRPKDIIQYPYVIITSTGKHTHPPPPPEWVPNYLMIDLVRLIKKINTPEMTYTRFSQHPDLQAWCKEWNGRTLGDIHQSLAKRDRISRLIYRNRLILRREIYPQGEQLEAILYHYRLDQNKPEHQYIQGVYNQGEDGTIIVCFHRKQAEVFIQQESFEVDMSFKRIRQQEVNEIIFSGFLEQHDKIFTYARVFVTGRTARTFFWVLKRLCECIQSTIGQRLTFNNIDTNGKIKAVAMDMDGAEISGLGHFLQTLNPHIYHDWRLYAMKVVIFCQIHFDRGIKRVTNALNIRSEVREKMRALLTCRVWPEYKRQCEELYTGPYPDAVKNWAKHKLNPVIANGLCEGVTLIDKKVWKRIRHSTNAVEQSGWKSYAYGMRQNLIPAIQQAATCDLNDITWYQNKEDFDINYRERNMCGDRREEREILRNYRKRARSSDTNISRSSRRQRHNTLLTRADSNGVILSRSQSRATSISRGNSQRGGSILQSMLPTVETVTRSLRSQTPIPISSSPPISDTVAIPRGSSVSTRLSQLQSSRRGNEPTLYERALTQKVQAEADLNAAKARDLTADAERKELENLRLRRQLEREQDL